MSTILTGDVREMLPTIAPKSVQCVVTSPPYYGLRDYGTPGQLGLEPTLAEYISGMVGVFRLVRDVLADDGTVWLNIGDSYASTGGVHQSGSYDGGVGRAMQGVPRFRPGAGRADGIVDDRNQRNRNGTVGIGFKPKDLMMVPARLAIALQDDGWWIRSDIVWAKSNPMPESVRDRPTSAHEHIFLLTKNSRYFYDADAIRTPVTSITTKMPDGWDTGSGAHGSFHRNGREKGATVSARDNFRRENSKRAEPMFGQTMGTHRPDRPDTIPNELGANARNVWSIATQPYSGAHFATFPVEIPRRCILAGSREGDTVLDPFAGAGTTLLVADRLGRAGIGIELNPEYVALARKRLYNDAPLFAAVAD